MTFISKIWNNLFRQGKKIKHECEGCGYFYYLKKPQYPECPRCGSVMKVITNR